MNKRQSHIIGFIDGKPVYSVSGAHNDFLVDQTEFAFYNDGTESGAAIIGSQGTDVTDLALDTVYQVRFEITETGAGAVNNMTWQLEAQVDGGGFVSVTDVSTNVRAAAGAVTDGEDTTQRLGGGGTFVGGDGVDDVDGLAGGPLNDWVGSEIGEVLFSFTLRSADLSGGEAIDLRIASMDAYTVPDASLTVAAGAINIDAITDVLVITENQATVNAETNIEAVTDALIITENQAIITLDANISAITDALVITENAATVNAEANVQANTDALVITENQATVNAETNINANTDALVITGNQATISLGVVVVTNVDALVLTEHQAVIKADTNVLANMDSLTLATLQATVALQTEAFPQSTLAQLGAGI